MAPNHLARPSDDAQCHRGDVTAATGAASVEARRAAAARLASDTGGAWPTGAPLCIAALLSLAIGMAMSPYVHTALGAPEPSAAQRWQAGVGAAAGYVLGRVAVGAAVWALCATLARPLTWPAAMGISVMMGWITVLRGCASFAVVTARGIDAISGPGDLSVSASLAFLAPNDGPALLSVALGSVDVLDGITAWVLVLGVTTSYSRAERTGALTVGLAYMLILLAGKMGLASVFQ